MDKLTLGVKSENGMWFGVLVDYQGELVASAFSAQHVAIQTHLAYVARKLTHMDPEPTSSPLVENMVSLFDGGGSTRNIPLNNNSVTEFQQKVYAVLKRIPRGRVTSYGRIAATINSGPRAVGTAVASNPWPLFVPCHRVVPSNMAVGNYSMSGQLTSEGSQVKKHLLIREGVLVEHERILPDSLWRPSER